MRGGVNPRRDRLKLDNSVTRAMQVVMKHARGASNRHLRNWEAADALVQEIIPVATPKIRINVQRFSIRKYIGIDRRVLNRLSADQPAPQPPPAPNSFFEVNSIELRFRKPKRIHWNRLLLLGLIFQVCDLHNRDTRNLNAQRRLRHDGLL